MSLVQRYHQEIWLQVVCKDEAAVPCRAKQTSPAQSYTTLLYPCQVISGQKSADTPLFQLANSPVSHC